MLRAIDEVKGYSQDGEVINSYVLVLFLFLLFLFFSKVITDARHDSTANAYHTTVPCLSGRLFSLSTLSTSVLLSFII